MRQYTLQYLTYSAPEEKHLIKIRNFPGIVVIREDAYMTYKMHSFRFEHHSNDLTLNMFKLSSPWHLFRSNIEKNVK